MLPDRVSNPGPLTYESGALPIALRGPAFKKGKFVSVQVVYALVNDFLILDVCLVRTCAHYCVRFSLVPQVVIIV